MATNLTHLKYDLSQHNWLVFESFFVKKYLLVSAWGMLWAGGSVDQWFSGSVDQWISERCMYSTGQM